jgi:hypothetical protein
VLGDSLGAGIVHHLSRHELEEMPIEPATGRRESDIEMDGPLAGVDLEKGESSYGGPSSGIPMLPPPPWKSNGSRHPC